MQPDSVDNRRSLEAVRQSLGPAPLVSFPHAPGAVPIATARLPDQAPGHPPATGTHAHDFLVLFYAHHATGTVAIDGQEWTVSDGDLFVLGQGQIVSFPQPREEIATEGWVVWFPAEVVRAEPAGTLSAWWAHPLLFPFARGIERAQRLRIPEHDRARWIDRFTALDSEVRNRRDGYHEAARAHLTLLLVAVARLPADVADQLRAGDEPLLAAVFDYIEEHYHEPISLADVAAGLALTAGHLTTVVRRRTGRTVQQWIAQRRLRQARLLLAGTDLPVAAISHRVGYPDVSYFIKRFRAEHRCTPAQWRATR